jgi:DNA-binding MarR family transcriptional regulator/GNAT superfamily N-acetyltransferase
MDRENLDQVRRFNRLITQRVGALEESYLRRGRPLGEARVIFEIGAGGADVGALRGRLGLDSGYMSRLLRSLEDQGLVETVKPVDDRRKRRAILTRKGRAERATYDRLSDRLAAAMLTPLDARQRDRLAAAMGEVERLMRAAAVEIAIEAPESRDARACLDAYFGELAARFEGGFDPKADRSSAADAYKPPDGAFVVARLDGAAVGCGALKRVDRATGEIKRVWTAPSARGLGVARRMLRKLEATAREMAMTVLRLDTNRALKEAHELYRKEGYREIARFNDNPYAHHWFEKRL